MKSYITVVVASLIALTYSQGPVDMKCVEQNCKTQFTACTSDPMCVKLTQCVDGCVKKWDDDKTPDKLEVQNCTNKCTYTYADDSFLAILGCMVTNKCVVLPATPNMCKAANVKFAKNISLSDVAGTWWTLRGLNSAYDCYPCQKTTFTATTMKMSFQAYTVDGGLKPFMLSGTVMDNSPKRGFNVSITLGGLPSMSTFWPFDLVEDGGNKYVLVYYCASESMWNYDGAYVFSAATTISAGAMDSIKSSFMTNVGLNFDDFCSPSTTNCPSN